MTAQIPDSIIYQEEKYVIAGIKGKKLLSPYDFDMMPEMMSTGCWRGYFCVYSCISDKFVLTEMTTRIVDDAYKEIDGVFPSEEFLGGMHYTGLHVDVPFTGKILIAKDFIEERYVHMGFQAPTSYETVIELEIKNGIIDRVTDFSEKICQLRQMKDGKKRYATASEMPNLMAWIEEKFSLDYDLD